MKRTIRTASRGRYVPARDELRTARAATRTRARIIARDDDRITRAEIRDYYAGGAA